MWGDAKKDDQGYLSTHTEPFATDTYALATDNLDLDLDLSGTSHALVTDVSYPDFDADYAVQDGDKRPGAPASKDFWAASTQGSGRQTITWDVEDGDWSVVVMNADGSRDVDVRVSAAAEVPLLAPLGWGFVIAGLLMLGLAAGATAVAVRQRSLPNRVPVAA